MMITRMIIQNSVIKVSRCCCDYLADTLRMVIIQSDRKSIILKRVKS
jgi:hypothetical protein